MPWHNPPKVTDAYKKAWPMTTDETISGWSNRAHEITTEQEQEHGPCTDEFPRKQVSESDL
jgi:hypothetical protein